MSLKESCKEAMPCRKNIPEYTEIFAMVLILSTLILSAYGDIELASRMAREIIGVSLLVLFGSKYFKYRSNKKKQ